MPLHVGHCCLDIYILLTDDLHVQHTPIQPLLAYGILIQRYHLGSLQNSNNRSMRGSTSGSSVHSPSSSIHYLWPLPLG